MHIIRHKEKLLSVSDGEVERAPGEGGGSWTGRGRGCTEQDIPRGKSLKILNLARSGSN